MPWPMVMALPMRVFWEISGQVDRIRFEKAILELEIGTALKSDEGAKDMHERLRKVAPSPFKLSGAGRMEISAQADPDAIDTLRSLAG